MKLTEAMIAWNPNTSEIEVGLWPDRTDWSRKYCSTAGACYAALHKMSLARQRMFLFISFNTIVVRDRVDPQAAHKAFLAIDEYRRLIAPDQSGADDD